MDRGRGGRLDGDQIVKHLARRCGGATRRQSGIDGVTPPARAHSATAGARRVLHAPLCLTSIFAYLRYARALIAPLALLAPRGRTCTHIRLRRIADQRRRWLRMAHGAS